LTKTRLTNREGTELATSSVPVIQVLRSNNASQDKGAEIQDRKGSNCLEENYVHLFSLNYGKKTILKKTGFYKMRSGRRNPCEPPIQKYQVSTASGKPE